MVEPHWDYFVHAPMEQGVVRFATKTVCTLNAKVGASEANWMESQSHWYLIVWAESKARFGGFSREILSEEKKVTPLSHNEEKHLFFD